MKETINVSRTSENKKEDGRDIKRRADNLIEILKGKKITILGHDNIDVDATLSGILMSRLLNFLKIENEFCILEPVKENETYEIINELIGINMKEWQKDQEDVKRNLFLLDHYETVHEGTVVGCIDHHPTQQKKDYNFMYVRDSCATAYLIYEIMKQVDFPIGKEEAKMIVVSMMVDTTSFRSSKTIKEEVEQAKKIAEEFQLDYNFLEKYCLCLTKIDKLTSNEIISNGQKWYKFNDKKVGSSYLQLYGLPNELQLKEWLNLLKNKLEKTSSDMLVFIIFETKENITYEYQVMNECIKKVVHKGILSRGKDIIPLIEDRFLQEINTKQKMERIVKILSEKNKTIATMESCTGGQLASEITNIEGASHVLEVSYVTYCNDTKIKFGVPKEIIEQYNVYSIQTAIAMAETVRNIANADIGVGITGQIGRVDPRNKGIENNKVWYAIKSIEGIFAEIILNMGDCPRENKKEIIIREIIEDLYNLAKR